MYARRPRRGRRVHAPLKRSSCRAHHRAAAPADDIPRTAGAGCHEQGVLALMQTRGIARQRVCQLDPKALRRERRTTVTRAGLRGSFSACALSFPRGAYEVKPATQGILGEEPPRDRTAELRALGFPTRYLGPVQTTTDTALGVTKRVIVDRVPLDEIPYVLRSTSRLLAAS
ncbi:hypothetical protein H4582DRAFT_1953167 [Lactarius indigo]|nr:hypothetical protein H4582DRAFT_1953167 [Lactarius indigo]